MTAIINRLKEKSSPPWSFATFMETALYEPEIGYYTNTSRKLGKDGDFYTSNHVNPVFAETFGRFFSDVIQKENLLPSICEWGAGDGTFAFHMLQYIKNSCPGIFEKMTYRIIESSPYHRGIIKDKLQALDEHVCIYSSFHELKADVADFEGIIFSNELLDAFPVHSVKMTEDGLKEIKVDVEKDELTEVMTDCENSKLQEWLDKYGPALPEGFRTEISPAMAEWMENVSEWLKRGMIVTVDYGYRNEELLKPERKDGSIRGYRNHEMVTNPLKHPGEMDLTAHIQWDAYDKIASQAGLEQVLHERQDTFLLKAGLFTFLQEPAQINPFSDEFKKNRAIQSLVHPGGISSSFQAAVHGRGLTESDSYKFFTEDPYQIKKP